MKKYYTIVCLVLLVLSNACRNTEEELIFDKPADARVAEAIGDLEAKLVAPAEGWLLKYRPEDESGVYNVLLNFNENGDVTIQTDFGVNEGEFYEQTITYRIDNSLGLELILENYSFFSFLFEQNQASFLAEYEFNYVNETPDGALVFSSKSDPFSPTTLVFIPASSGDINLLGKELASNLTTLSENSPALFASSYRLRFTDQDLTFYLSLDDFGRTITFNYVSPDGSENGQELAFSSPYTVQGNDIILDNPLEGSYFGQQVSIPSVRFGALSSLELTACNETINANQYTATVNSKSAIVENTLFDPNGANFAEESNFFYCWSDNVFAEGRSIGTQIEEDVDGALALLLYYDENGQSDPSYALGFYIANESGTYTRALREFTPTLAGNQLQVAFDSTFTVLQDTTTSFNEESIDKYLNIFNEGDGMYIYKVEDNTYEFYNACNGTSFVFFHN